MAMNDRYALQKAAWLLAASVKDFMRATGEDLKSLDKGSEAEERFWKLYSPAMHDARIALAYMGHNVPYLNAKSEAEFREAHEKEMKS